MRQNNHQTAKSRGRHARRRRGGFTLIEASLTTVIIGTGVLAIVGAQQAYHIKNDYAVRSNTGHLLANEIRELTVNLPHHDPVTGDANLGPEAGEAAITDFDDLDDFAGTVSAGVGSGMTINPPVNAVGIALADMGRWTQEVTVGNVQPGLIDVSQGNMQGIGTTDVMRVNVRVFYRENNGNQSAVASLTWIVPD